MQMDKAAAASFILALFMLLAVSYLAVVDAAPTAASPLQQKTGLSTSTLNNCINVCD